MSSLLPRFARRAPWRLLILVAAVAVLAVSQSRPVAIGFVVVLLGLFLDAVFRSTSDPHSPTG